MSTSSALHQFFACSSFQGLRIVQDTARTSISTRASSGGIGIMQRRGAVVRTRGESRWESSSDSNNACSIRMNHENPPRQPRRRPSMTFAASTRPVQAPKEVNRALPSGTTCGLGASVPEVYRLAVSASTA